LRTQIFVSYCHDDVKGDDNRLRAFLNAIRDTDRDAFELIVDYEHPGASVGANVETFMRRVDTADVVIVLLTPGYKRRVGAKSESGVYTEFRRVYDRIMHAESRGTYDKDFVVLPVIFTGTFDESCPLELRRLHCADVTWMYVSATSDLPTVHASLKNRFATAVGELTSRVRAIAATKDRAFREQQEDLFQSFLFHDTKSRWDKPENYPYLESAFVKTWTFLRVRNHEVNFVVGRKGSGKSTITHVLPLLAEPRPAVVLRIDFEQLPFEMCFNVLKGHPAEASDLRHAFSPIYSYEMLWDVFVHLFYAWQIRSELPAKGDVPTKVFKMLEKSTKGANDAERDATATRVLFVHAFERLVVFIDTVMRQKEQDSLTRSVAEFTQTRFRSFVFGNTWPALQKILKRQRQTNSRTLLTIDGFDVRTDYFTREAEERSAAVRFENELLLALFQVILKTYGSAGAHSMFYELTDMCAAIPHDRFMQVRALDRDRYQYRHHFAPVSWSGPELSALVRKRLVLLRKAGDPKALSLEERLSSVMRSKFPELPDDLAFQFGAAPYHISLFLYVLRHTFWRPRDVLFFYSTLLAASSQSRKRRETVSTAFVRQIIAGATRTVIEDEFLREYSNSFRNLKDVLFRFREYPQVMKFDDFSARIGDIRFDAPLPEGEIASTEWKAEMLYEVGALGVILDRATAERFSSFRHAFIFNEGDLLTKRLGRDLYHKFQFTLHPVLVEYLHLDTTGNPELILPLDWDYLRKKEDITRSTPC